MHGPFDVVQCCDYYPKPGCGGGAPVKRVTVTYHEEAMFSDEFDVLDLCRFCAGFVEKDARQHGYKVETATL